MSPLSGLTELRSLSVYHDTYLGDDYNHRILIKDLTPLSGLTKLNSLQVIGTAENIDTSPVAFAADLKIK